MTEKAIGAYRTIGELSAEIGVPQHILRYWETRFPQLRPLKRAGGRRHYRPGDVALVRRINDLLTREGYTIRGVQSILTHEVGRADAPAAISISPGQSDDTLAALMRARTILADALAHDDQAR